MSIILVCSMTTSFVLMIAFWVTFYVVFMKKFYQTGKSFQSPHPKTEFHASLNAALGNAYQRTLRAERVIVLTLKWLLTVSYIFLAGGFVGTHVDKWALGMAIVALTTLPFTYIQTRIIWGPKKSVVIDSKATMPA